MTMTPRDELLMRYEGFASSLARRMAGLPGCQRYEDLRQEALLEMLRAIDRHGPDGVNATYLWRAAQGGAINGLRDLVATRAQHRRARTIVDSRISDWRSARHTGFGRVDDRDDVEAVLSRLRPRDRRLLIAVHMDERPSDEIAEAEGLRRNSVKRVVFRARAKARKAQGERRGDVA